jgi:uncharacterized RDD family membrane protein YckC
VKYLAHASGLKEWLPLGEVLDYVEQGEGPRMPSLPPVPGPRELPPIPLSPTSHPPILPAPISHTLQQPAPPPPPPLPVSSPVEKPEIKPENKPVTKPEVQLTPASFFQRGFAFLIDCAILFVPIALLYLLGALTIWIPSFWNHASIQARTEDWDWLWLNTRRLFWLVLVGFGWLYVAGLESSRSQATVGKRWMGIKVTDAHGERMSFLRATGRYAVKYLSALPCFLGFIMVLFSSRGLALHDRLADTRVVRG